MSRLSPARRLATVALFSVSPLLAQLPSPVSLDPLLVTAQKRGQSIDEVPISITAYTGSFLDQLGATSYADLAPLVPGFFVSSQSPNDPSINIRGIGSDSIDPRQQPRISIFQDGVAISRAPASFVELFDLERVEVLKGPQGTLFGRDAGAGALSLISRKPAPATEASLTLGTGNFGREHASGYLNRPLGSDRLLGRIAFTSEHRDGITRNVVDGSDLGSRETVAVRPSLRWIPQPRTTVDLIVNVQRDTPAGTAFKSGVIPPPGGDTSPFTAAGLTRGAALGVDRTVAGATLLLEHQLTDRWTLNSVTAWRSYDAFEQLDIDGSFLALIEASDDSHGHQFSQELRLNFDTGRRLTGFMGVAYARERAWEQAGVYVDERAVWPFLSGNFRNGLLAAGVPAALVQSAVPAMNPLAPQARLPASFAAFALVPSLSPLAALAGAPLQPYHADTYLNAADLDATDVFADATWRAADRLEFTAGARLSFEDQTGGYDAPPSATPSAIGFLLGNTPNFAVLPTPGRLAETDRTVGWAGRAIARYIFAPSLNAYASLSRGRRPEALLVGASGPARADEESVVNAELGAKGTAAHGRLAWSAAVFRYRYAHFQTQVQDPANLSRFVVTDAGRATGSGAEFSARAAVTDAFSAFATYGYTDASFDAADEHGAPQLYAGSTFRLTARHTAAVGAMLQHDASSRGRFALSPVWQYQSAHFFEDDNTRLGGTLRQPGFALVNVRLAWTSPARAWEAVLFADNLFDKHYLIDAGNIGANFGLPTFIRGAPRLLGLNLSHRW